MSYNLNWMPDAEFTFSQNIEYLESEWNEKVIAKFLERIAVVLQTIKETPYLKPSWGVIHKRKVQPCDK